MKINKKYNFEKNLRLVNAGGFDETGVNSTPYELIFMEIQPFSEWGNNISKLGEVRYGEITPALTNF